MIHGGSRNAQNEPQNAKMVRNCMKNNNILQKMCEKSFTKGKTSQKIGEHSVIFSIPFFPIPFDMESVGRVRTHASIYTTKSCKKRCDNSPTKGNTSQKIGEHSVIFLNTFRCGICRQSTDTCIKKQQIF